MKIIFDHFLISVLVMLLHLPSWAQQGYDIDEYSRVSGLPNRLFQKIDMKSTKMSRRLTQKMNKYLSMLVRRENKLRNQMARKDSLAARRIFGDIQNQYDVMRSTVMNASLNMLKITNIYLPHLDSLKTAFQFLNKSDRLFKQVYQKQYLTEAIDKMNLLQNKFVQAEYVGLFIQDRQRYLQDQLANYKLLDELKSYRKEAYYYGLQIEQYKQLYSNPSRLEGKAMEVLSRTTKFREYFAQNSQLARLFRLPGGSVGNRGREGNHQLDLVGLQTRAATLQELQQRFGSSTNVQPVMCQTVQNLPVQLSNLKEQIAKKLRSKNSVGQESGPDFKPNSQKTKSFMQRLEVGGNLQTVKATRFFPSTTDIGMSLGYKMNDKYVIGVGGSYKMGWGENLRHLKVTHQGVGLRTYINYKLRGSLWISGGGELNHRSEFKSLDVLKNYNSWQRSALLGVSRKYQISSKMKGNLQLLYDVLWKQQVPRTQPLLFRIGYSLKQEPILHQ